MWLRGSRCPDVGTQCVPFASDFCRWKTGTYYNRALTTGLLPPVRCHFVRALPEDTGRSPDPPWVCRSAVPGHSWAGRQNRTCCLFSNLICFPPTSSPTMLGFVPFPCAVFSHIVATSHMPFPSGTQCPLPSEPFALRDRLPEASRCRSSPVRPSGLVASARRAIRDPRLHGSARGGGAVPGDMWVNVGDVDPGIAPLPGGTTQASALPQVCLSRRPGSARRQGSELEF